MAPAVVTLDDTADLDDFASTPTTTTAPEQRTLLLAPPSLASNEHVLAAILSRHDRSAVDLQMLDRLSAGLVRLPAATYDLVLILSAATSPLSEATSLLSRAVCGPVAESLRPGGHLRAHDKAVRLDTIVPVAREAVLAGLVVDTGTGGFSKPDYGDAGEVVSLVGLRSKKSTAGPAVGATTVKKLDGRVETVVLEPATVTPAGVGFVSLEDDLDDDDDELIDEDTLLTEEDCKKVITLPAECEAIQKPGKRKRACKDCTCGLAEKLATEDAEKRASADAKLQVVVSLSADDLHEVDYTVRGKVGSCGSCALGDAFRCFGCPYVGFPAWNTKPGEEVRLFNNDVQL